MTQEGLGQALKPYLGRAWSRQAVSIAETGGRSFVIAELFVLASVLQVPLFKLLSVDVLTTTEGKELLGKLTLRSGKEVDARLAGIAFLGFGSEGEPDGFDRPVALELFSRVQSTASEKMLEEIELLERGVDLIKSSRELLLSYAYFGTRAAEGGGADE